MPSPPEIVYIEEERNYVITRSGRRSYMPERYQPIDFRSRRPRRRNWRRFIPSLNVVLLQILLIIVFLYILLKGFVFMF